jgi:predicted transglutaminase-like cysteine proteinase
MTVELIRKVHQEALELFIYKTDTEQFKKLDHWMNKDEIQSQISMTGKLTGDCDDFAAYCVWNLREKGLKARYVFCQVETGEYHLVAECNGWTLDNRQRDIIPFGNLPYVWISISGYIAGKPWNKIL